MLYPPLEEGHEVLGQDYCSGYSDIHGKWNTGFYCPPIIPDVPVFCCGTVVLKYCCTLARAIQGVQHGKGYDSRNTDQEEEDQDADDHEQTVNTVVPETTSDVVEDFDNRSLLIGIVCGLVAVASLITVVSCFYCSCCLLYKKRRGRQLSRGGLLYGIPSSSTTTTCGLLNSFGNITSGNSAVVTRTGAVGDCASSTANHTTTATMPNFITTAPPLNPMVDYWSSTGGSSNSSSCGVATGGTASSTLIVAATATSLSPPNIVAGHAPHHIHHGSVYHHHHHYTTSSPVIGPAAGTLLMAPVQHLEPPPPYLAVATQGSDTHAPCCDSTGAGLSTTARTPQRTSSRRAAGENVGQNVNLLVQRHFSLLQNPHATNNCSNVNNNPITTITTTSPGNSNYVSSIVAAGGSGGSNGNSPGISVVTSSPQVVNNSSTTGGRGSLPPPYFVEQYRIRNRVRPPPFHTNSSNSGSTSSSRNHRNRAQETINNWLYPLLNATMMPTSRHGQSEGRRRGTTAMDTQSEPRRSHHHHHHSHNHHRTAGGSSVGGSVLHRSSSDRQQNCVSPGSTARCYTDGDSGNNPEGVVALNNLINNLSAGTGSMGRSRRTCYGTGAAAERLNATSVGGVEQSGRSRTGSSERSRDNDNRTITDNLGKILNTELQHRRGHQEVENFANRNSRDHRSGSPILSTSTNPILLSTFGSFSARHNCDPQQMNSIVLTTSMSQQRVDSSDNSNRDGLVRRRREDELNENEGPSTTTAANDNDDNGDMDEDEDIMMMEDEEDEVIAVVTTAHHHHHLQTADEDEVEEVDIIDDLVMSFGREEEEEYLVEDENSEENSTDKLSESAPNSSMSASVDASHSHPNNKDKNESSKRRTGSPSSLLAGNVEADGIADGNNQRLKQQTRTNSDSASTTNEGCGSPTVNLVTFVKTSDRPV